MATVRATTPVRLVALDRTDFLAGVSSHARSTQAAEHLADERLPVDKRPEQDSNLRAYSLGVRPSPAAAEIDPPWGAGPSR